MLPPSDASDAEDDDESSTGHSLSGISLSELSNAAFETLYFLQKNESYKKIYIAAKLASCIFVIQLCLGNVFNPRNLVEVANFARIFSLPAPELPLESFYAAYAVAAALVLSTVGSMCFVTYSLAKGSLSRHWPARMLRFLLGIIQTFSDPLTPVLLAFLDCKYFDVQDDVPFGKNNNWDVGCGSGAVHISLFALSIALTIFFAISLMYSTIMHVNDPGSYNLLARAHSRLDILQQGLNFFLTSSFLVLRDFPGWLAFLFTACQVILLVLFLVFQPYYHGFMNDLTTALCGITLWTGVVFSIAVASRLYDSEMLGYLFLVGLIPSFGAGWMASRMFRQWLITRTLARFAHFPDADSVPVIDDDDVFPVISRLYDPNRTSWFPKALKGALVEVRTRFLQTDRSPRAIAIAYYLFKRGLQEHPQSGYLRLQYISFLVCYTGNVGLASHRLTEFSKISLDWDLSFSLLRKRRELQRYMLKEHLGADITNMDSIGFEEIKKMIKVANKQQIRSLQLVKQLWSTLSQQRRHKNTTGTDSLIPLIEDIHKSESMADRAYAYLIGHTNDSLEVMSSYARYLRQVKDDQNAAADLEERCDDIRNANKTTDIQDELNKSKSGLQSSHMTRSVTSSQGSKRAGRTSLIVQQAQRVFQLKVQLQAFTLVLLGMVTTIFVVYFLGLENLKPVFISSNESGARRYYAAQGAAMARDLHFAALNYDEKTFNATRAELKQNMENLWHLHDGLVHVYGTTLPQLNDLYKKPVLSVTSAARDGTSTTAVNGDELIQRFVINAHKMALQPMSKFRKFNHSNPMTFPELFYVLENTLDTSSHMDTATILYEAEGREIQEQIITMLFSCSTVAAILEVCLVLLVFRPSINKMFEEFTTSTLRFLDVPQLALKALVKSSAKASQAAVGSAAPAAVPPKEAAATFDLDNDEVDLATADPELSLISHKSKTRSVDPLPHEPLSMNKLTAALSAVSMPEREPEELDFSGSSTPMTQPRGSVPNTPPNYAREPREGSNGPARSRTDLSRGSHRRPVPFLHMVTELNAGLALDAAGPETQGPQTNAEEGHEKPSVTKPFALPPAVSAEVDPFPRDADPFPRENDPSPRDAADGDPTAAQLPGAVAADSGGDAAASPRLTLIPRGPSFGIRSPPGKGRRPSSVRSVHFPEAREEAGARSEDDCLADNAEFKNIGILQKPTPSQKDKKQDSDSSSSEDSDEEREKAKENRARDRKEKAARKKKREEGLLCRVANTFKDMLDMVRSRRGKRKAFLMLIYYSCLGFISLCLFLLAFMGYDALIKNSVNEINNSGRLRDLSRRLGFLSQELLLTRSPTANFLGGALSHLNSTADIRCELDTTARAFYQVHYALLYGREIGFNQVRETNGWPEIELSTKCQPFTRDKDLFELSLRLAGSVDKWPGHRHLYFQKNCMTELPFDDNSVSMTNPRIRFFTKDFKDVDCTFHNQDDPTATHGLHRMVEDVALAYLRFSTIPDHELTDTHQDYVFAKRYQNGSPELEFGLVKSVLLYQHEALTQLQSNGILMAFLYSFVVTVILLQYLILGRRIEALMNQNLMMILIMERLLAQAERVSNNSDANKKPQESIFNAFVKCSNMQAPPTSMSIPTPTAGPDSAAGALGLRLPRLVIDRDPVHDKSPSPLSPNEALV